MRNKRWLFPPNFSGRILVRWVGWKPYGKKMGGIPLGFKRRNGRAIGIILWGNHGPFSGQGKKEPLPPLFKLKN